MDRLQKEYGEMIEFRNVMGLLVRDVSDFMTPEERSLDPEEGIRMYCKRLARINKSEEAIGGLPINMDNFRLFDIIIKTVKETEIDEEAFIRHYQDGSAETALKNDLTFARSLGIHSLSAYLLQYNEKKLLL